MRQGEFDITLYGAIGDGVAVNTGPINRAVEAAARTGGTVIVPPGDFVTGTVFLRSGVTLWVCRGARLLGSTQLSDYAKLRWGHHMDRTPYHLIVADGCSGTAIAGEGIIDGRGSGFWDADREHEWAFFTITDKAARPSPMVEFTGCTDVRVENVCLTNSAGWTLHLHDCDRVAVRGVTIRNSPFGPNTDGIDVTGSRDVIITDCLISTGDDAVALKTTQDSRSCERVVVADCILESSCAALRLGYESDRDIRCCTFSNCIIKNASRGIDLVVFSGGTIENISFSNIVGRVDSGWLLDRPIEVYLTEIPALHEITAPDHPNYRLRKTIERQGRIRNVVFSDVALTTPGRILVGAKEGMEIEGLTFRNIRLDIPLIDDPHPVGTSVEGRASFFVGMPELRGARAAFAACNVADLRVEGFSVEWPRYPADSSCVTILRSPHRRANASYYLQDLDRLLSGGNAPQCHAFWGRNVRGGRIDLRDARGSREGVPVADVRDSDTVVLR